MIDNKILIVVPAYNEAQNLNNVLNELFDFATKNQILVVDDGSIDETSKIAKAFGVQVLTLPFNLGVGAAIRLGFRYALQNDFTYVLQFDGDGQHSASEISKLCAASSEYDLVIGSRFSSNQSKYETGRLRRLVMILISRLLKLLIKVKISDPTSGFRLSGPRTLEFFSKNYPPEYLGDTIESIVIGVKNGYLIGEVPVQMRQRQNGEPSQKTFRLMIYTLRALLVILISAKSPRIDFKERT